MEMMVILLLTLTAPCPQDALDDNILVCLASQGHHGRQRPVKPGP